MPSIPEGELVPSTVPSTDSSESRLSSVYDSNFIMHLIDHNIYPPFHDFPDKRSRPMPANWEEICQALKAPRQSLSPSRVDASTWEDFRCRVQRSRSKGTVMRTVTPLLTGTAPDIVNEGNLPFTHIASITPDTTVYPWPDFFDGAEATEVDLKVQEHLDTIIMPSGMHGVPVAPNFFLEVQGSGRTLEVTEAQIVLDGAHGSRIMHALQNHLVGDKTVPGGNAYAFTSTLVSGCLNL